MGRFDDIKVSGKKILGNLKPLPSSEINVLRRRYPHVPLDYTEFLREVGHGNISDCFAIYSGLIRPSDIYDAEKAKALGPVLLFGDDFQGYCYGFDPTNAWQVVEVDANSHTLNVEGASFADFIQEKIKSLEN